MRRPIHLALAVVYLGGATATAQTQAPSPAGQQANGQPEDATGDDSGAAAVPSAPPPEPPRESPAEPAPPPVPPPASAPSGAPGPAATRGPSAPGAVTPTPPAGSAAAPAAPLLPAASTASGTNASLANTWGSPPPEHPVGTPADDAGITPRVTHLALELSAAAVTRISSSSSFEHGQLVDTAYSAALWYESREQFAIGARYEFTGLGTGMTQTTVDRIEASYDAHVLWAAGRLYPYRRGDHSVFLGVGLGLVFMQQSAHGTRTLEFDQPAGVPFSCSATGTPDLGLGTALGFTTRVSDHVKFVGQAGASMLRGAGEVTDGCVPGLGATITLNASLGFAYMVGL